MYFCKFQIFLFFISTILLPNPCCSAPIQINVGSTENTVNITGAISGDSLDILGMCGGNVPCQDQGISNRANISIDGNLTLTGTGGRNEMITASSPRFSNISSTINIGPSGIFNLGTITEAAGGSIRSDIIMTRGSQLNITKGFYHISAYGVVQGSISGPGTINLKDQAFLNIAGYLGSESAPVSAINLDSAHLVAPTIVANSIAADNASIRGNNISVKGNVLLQGGSVLNTNYYGNISIDGSLTLDSDDRVPFAWSTISAHDITVGRTITIVDGFSQILAENDVDLGLGVTGTSKHDSLNIMAEGNIVAQGSRAHEGDILALNVRAGGTITAKDLYAQNVQAQAIQIENETEIYTHNLNLTGRQQSTTNTLILNNSSAIWNNLAVNSTMTLNGSTASGGLLTAGTVIIASDTNRSELNIASPAIVNLNIGKNGYATVGSANAAWLSSITNQISGATGALGIKTPYFIPANGSLAVDPQILAPQANNNQLYFAPQSLLVVNGGIAQENSSGAIAAESRSEAVVAEGAKLMLAGVSANKIYRVLGNNLSDGGDISFSGAGAWDGENLMTDSHLLRISRIPGRDGYFEVLPIKSEVVYPPLDGEIGDIIDGSNGGGAGGDNSSGSNGGAPSGGSEDNTGNGGNSSGDNRPGEIIGGIIGGIVDGSTGGDSSGNISDIIDSIIGGIVDSDIAGTIPPEEIIDAIVDGVIGSGIGGNNPDEVIDEIISGVIDSGVIETPGGGAIGTENHHFYSPWPGVRFLSRAGSVKYMDHNYRLAVTTMESASRIAVVGAVPQLIMAANTASQEAANSRNFIGRKNLESTESTERDIAFWAIPLFKSINGFDLHANNFTFDYSAQMGGLIIGSDWTFEDRFRLGIDLSTGGGYSQSGGDLAKTTNKMGFWGFGLYSSYLIGNFNIGADLHYTSSWNSLEQEIPSSMQMRDLEGELTAQALSAKINFQYAFQWNEWQLIPHAGARFLYVHTDPYSINSNGAVIDGRSIDQNIWTFPAGARLSGEFATESGWQLRPAFDLSAIPAAGDIEAKTSIRFTGTYRDANLHTQTMDYLTLKGSLGFEAAKGPFNLGIHYDIEAGLRSVAQSVFANFRYEF